MTSLRPSATKISHRHTALTQPFDRRVPILGKQQIDQTIKLSPKDVASKRSQSAVKNTTVVEAASQMHLTGIKILLIANIRLRTISSVFPPGNHPNKVDPGQPLRMTNQHRLVDQKPALEPLMQQRRQQTDVISGDLPTLERRPSNRHLTKTSAVAHRHTQRFASPVRNQLRQQRFRCAVMFSPHTRPIHRTSNLGHQRLTPRVDMQRKLSLRGQLVKVDVVPIHSQSSRQATTQLDKSCMLRKRMDRHRQLHPRKDTGTRTVNRQPITSGANVMPQPRRTSSLSELLGKPHNSITNNVMRGWDNYPSVGSSRAIEAPSRPTDRHTCPRSSNRYYCRRHTIRRGN